MSQRFLKIKNFRNIGITKGEDGYQTLYLNNSLNKDKIGELIILIGENNVGKSNVLDAINSISLAEKSKKEENFTNCIPDFMDYEECLPSLKLVYKDDDNNSYDLELSIDEEGNAELINNLPKDIKTIEPQLNLDKVKEEIESKFSAYNNEIKKCPDFHQRKNSLINDYNTIIKSDKNEKEKYNELKDLYLSLKNFFDSFIGYYNGLRYISNLEKLHFIDLDNNVVYENGKYARKIYKDIIKEKYDIDFIPNIIFYDKNIKVGIKDDELKTTPEEIKDSKFFNSLFKAIGKSMSTIATAYEKAKKTPGHKDQYQESINKKLKDIVNKKFNELYFQNLGVQEYSFEIKLEKDEIYLSMRKNGSIITLAQQSVGFKWFFNFFFNFLYANELKAGDIVLMDEPEIHLSIPGRRDLRKFIKKFARDTGITFICTTHNPSFADIDYLDELRIIEHNKNGVGVKIKNNFSVVGDEEVDTLDSIVNSFGILRSDLTREHKIIFVEGITDYNYLTAFKLLYNKDKKEDEKLNIDFIPINGLGKDNNAMRDKLAKLVLFKDAILLTDGDARGNIFKKLCDNEKFKDKLSVIQLTEIDNSFKDIENLFSQNDKEKFKPMIENKSISLSSLFKNTIFHSELDTKTADNFNKVLVFLNTMS